jgi:hypothetical protein
MTSNARWFGLSVIGAALLLSAGPARAAYDGAAGDTGGPPAPEVSAATAKATADAVYLGSPVADDAWAGDTGGPPPPTASERREDLARANREAGGAPRVASSQYPRFTDRG